MSIKRTIRNVRSKVTRSSLTWSPTPNLTLKNVQGPDGRIEPPKVCDEQNDFITTYVQDRVFNTGTQTWESPPYVDCNYVV